MCGVHQALVKHQIAGHVAVEVVVKVLGAVLQGFMQPLEVVVGAAQRRQPDGLGFEDVPGFAGLLEAATRQHLHGGQRVDIGAQVGAVALAHFDQAAEGEHAHRFTHGIAADA
ncbi:hypothetical protein D3C77_519280 [compost metagenome]